MTSVGDKSIEAAGFNGLAPEIITKFQGAGKVLQ